MSGGAVAGRLATPDGRPVAGTLTMDRSLLAGVPAVGRTLHVEIDIQAFRG